MTRISTFAAFQRQAEQISRQYDKLGRLQAQLSSGKKLVNNSDDPVLASQLNSIQDYIDKINTYSHNTALAKGRCALVDTMMSGAVNAVSDLQNQIKTAQTGTVSDWSAFANKMQSDLSTLLRIANTQDATGQYIFSGSNATSPAYVQNGSGYVYQGSMESTTIDIGINASTRFNESGYYTFGNIPTGNGTFTVTAGNQNTGTASTDAGTVDKAAYVADTYTVSFVTNNEGQLAVKVVGATSGQVIPANGQDAPAYTSGMDLAFNGVHLSVSGAANVGDSFQVQPSTKQNMFDTISQLISTLKNPPANSGEMKQLLTQAGASISQIASHIIDYQAQAGLRTGNIDMQAKANQQLIDNQTDTLSNLGDADYAQVMTQLSQQSLILQATQEGFLRIQQVLDEFLK